MDIRKLIKEGVRSVKKNKMSKRQGVCPSDEDIASFASGSLAGKKRERLLSHILSCDTCGTSLKRYLQLLTAETISDGRRKVSGEVISRIKEMAGDVPSKGMLEAVVELSRNFIRVVKTTGTMLTDLSRRRPVPVKAFREKGETEERSVVISKPAYNYIVDIKIERMKKSLAALTVYLKDKKTQSPSAGERISLVLDGRELESSLTKNGKVKFANVEPGDYRIQLIRRKEPIYIATVFLKTLE